MNARASVSLAVAVFLLTSAAGCKKKVSQAQCETLLEHFAVLVVNERIKDAPPELIKAEQDRERHEARGDEAFRNCTSEIAQPDFDCAMKAGSSDALLKCLE
jgi:hypothetical protein